jgi:hypothetical protein
LAEIVRLDRAHHRRIAGDSELAEHVKIATQADDSEDPRIDGAVPLLI